MSVSFSNQLTPNNYPTNTRAVVDNNFVQTSNLAASGANVATNAIDLQQATPYPTTEIINVLIAVSAGTGTTNSHNINVTLQHTSANSDGTANSAAWANSTVFATPLVQVTDNSGAFAAASATVKLPPNELRFIRALAVTEANSGTPVGTVTIELLF